MASRSAKILALVTGNKKNNLPVEEQAESNTNEVNIFTVDTPVISDVDQGLHLDNDIIKESDNNHFHDPNNPNLLISTEKNLEEAVVVNASDNVEDEKYYIAEEDAEFEEPFQDSGSSYCPSVDSDEYLTLNDNERGNNADTKPAESKKRAKKGQCDKNTWKRIKAKTGREKGQAYEGNKKARDGTKTMIMKNPRIMKERCNSKKCANSKQKRKCSAVTECVRQDLFNMFWSELDWKQRKIFIATLVNKSETIQKTTKNKESRRKTTLSYHLKVNDTLIPVCKNMFLNTFALGEWTILNWVKQSHHSGIVSTVTRFPNKVKQSNNNRRTGIKEFFEKLPKMPSHYCRSSTSKIYLENIFDSYTEIYNLYRKEVTECTSKQVFVSEMRKANIDIFRPRKDQCDLCFSFKQGNVDVHVYQSHINEKNRARLEKQNDKQEAIAGNVCAFTMDVQAVQLVPCLPAGMIYFKQKLACHNFTIYNLASDSVVCYVWHEGEGGMDANCFATCLRDFIDTEVTEDDKKETKIFYSDGCCAQNRHTTLANALLHHCITTGDTIIQKYLVKGHSQMECDSVHSTIEACKKNKEIHAPSNYVQLIQQSRKNSKGPYKVKYVDHEFFNNFNGIKYFSSIRPGLKTGDACVTDLRALKYSSSGIQYKQDFDNEWLSLPRRMTNTAGTIAKMYDAPLALKGDKFEHLQSLKKVIHKDYHGFYDSLKH